MAEELMSHLEEEKSSRSLLNFPVWCGSTVSNKDGYFSFLTQELRIQFKNMSFSNRCNYPCLWIFFIIKRKGFNNFKQRGFLLLRITRGFSFSFPLIFAPSRIVTPCLLSFSEVHFLHLNDRVLSAKDNKINQSHQD